MIYKKILLSTIVATSLLFTGCGEDSDEAKAYDIELALDNGEYDKALTLLGDCSQFNGDAKLDCYLNVGAAYFGKANFDMLSLSQEITSVDDNLSSDDKSKEFSKIIFTKLDDNNLKVGIKWYKKILDNNNSSVCNPKEYQTLTTYSKRACISLNPLLLSDLLDDDNTTNDSEITVSLEQIIEFKDIIQDAVPEINAEDLVAIISGDKLDNDKDINANGKLDSTEVTNYVIKEFNGKTYDSNNTITQSKVIPNAYGTTTGLLGATYVKVTVRKSQDDDTNKKDYHRVMQKISGGDNNTSLSIIANTVCDDSNTPLKTASVENIGELGYLPCIKVKEDGNISSLNDSVLNLLNSSLIESIALASESEDDNKTDTIKISEFKEKLADDNGTITQESFMKFLSEKKDED